MTKSKGAAPSATRSKGGASGSQSEDAYTRLLDALVSLDLPPGSYVSESELSERVGLGRTPVREAIQRLAIEEFCQVLPRRGILIAPIDMNRQFDVHELRLVLEPAAARLAAERIDDGASAALRDLLERYSSLALGDPSAEPSPDEQMHRAIVGTSRNPLMARTLAPLYAHARRHWNQHRHRGLKDPEAILHDWSDIVEAVCTGDGKAAERLMREHVEAARLALLNPSG